MAKEGRPPIYNTPEEMQQKIDEYFKGGYRTRQVRVGSQKTGYTMLEVPKITITDLVLFLGFCDRASFYDYEKKPEFSVVIRKARAIINPPSNKPKFKYRTPYKNISARVIERRALDPQYRLRGNVGALLRYGLSRRGITKGGSVWDIVGYSVSELRKHLEERFDDGMTWDNYGSEWHLDHIRPESWFLYKSVHDEDFKKCWALDNLQPLWASENMAKGNWYEG
jgi:hypothetical protein